MPCKHRTTPLTGTAATQLVQRAIVFGEKGFMKLRYVGNDPHIVYGEITDHPYNWARTRTQYVDQRDAVYLLGMEFMP